MQQVSRQTMAIAERLRVKNPKLTLRQAVRRAMWLSEQSQVLSEQIQDLQRDRRQAQASKPQRKDFSKYDRNFD